MTLDSNRIEFDLKIDVELTLMRSKSKPNVKVFRTVAHFKISSIKTLLLG